MPQRELVEMDDTTVIVKRKTKQQVAEEHLLDTLAELGGQRVADDDLIFQGRQLIVPETMTEKDVIVYMQNRIEQLEEETQFDRVFKFRPLDGAHALQEALRKVFGTAGIGKAEYTFFGKKPPQMRSIPIGPNRTVQVPWGKIAVPLFKGNMYTSEKIDSEYGKLFHLIVQAPRRFRAHVEGLFMAVQQELEQNSIYKGQAIEGQDEPEFMDIAGLDSNRVIYSDEVQIQLEANVWSLLKHSQQMRNLGIPLKRAVLLDGTYGTGKTLAAFLTAQIATHKNNGWTFIYCRPGKDDLMTVMMTARLYQPSVVFFEDVDIIAESGDRDSVTQLLDVFDGITAKNTEIMAVLTTNHIERIHKGMIRPGRLDALIHIGAWDQHGVQRAIEVNIPKDLREENLDFVKIYEAMEGYLPAFVKEAIDRTLRYAVSRTGGASDFVLATPDFVHAAEGLRRQLNIMEGADEGKLPDPLETQIAKLISKELAKTEVNLNDGDLIGMLVPSNGK